MQNYCHFLNWQIFSAIFLSTNQKMRFFDIFRYFFALLNALD